jgi:hypothetical protein
MSFLSSLKKPVEKIDRHILEKYPLLWETKLHWVFYFVLLTHLIVAAIVLLFNILPGDKDAIDTVYGISFIPIILAIGFWVTIVIRFNLNNENGSEKKWMEAPKFLVLSVSLALFFSLSYTVPLTMAYNESKHVDWNELKSEINILNEGNPYFLDNQVPWQRSDNSDYTNECIKEKLYKNYFFEYSFTPKQKELLGIKDTTELELSYRDSSESTIKRKITDYIRVSQKYESAFYLSVDSIYQLHTRKCSLFMRSENDSYTYTGPEISSRNYYYINSKIEEEVDVITYNLFFLEVEMLWPYSIAILMFATVLLLLKSLRWQSFVLLPVFFIPFSIISVVVFLLAFEYYNEERGMMAYFLICFILCLLWGIRGAYKKSYSWFAVICLMMAQLCIPFLPVYILCFCREMNVYMPGLYKYDYTYDSTYNYSLYGFHEWSRETYMIVGIVLYVFLLPVFKYFQVKYCSLPRAK